MRYKNKMILIIGSLITFITLVQCTDVIEELLDEEKKDNPTLISEGRHTFRYDTFGDEDFWSGLLHLDKAIAGAKNGGFGAGVSPQTALAVGLKVDAEALPADVVAGPA